MFKQYYMAGILQQKFTLKEIKRFYD